MPYLMRRITLSFFLTAVALVGWSAPAGAHAELRSTDPANGAVLTSPPPRITLEFTGAVEVALASFRVVDGSGQEVDVGPPEHPDGVTRIVSVDPPALTPGTYAVAWRIVSADAHPLQGTFSFQVSPPGPLATTAPAAPPPDNRVLARQLLDADEGGSIVGALYGVTRFASFAGLLLLVGAGMFVLWLWPSGLAVTRVRRLIVGAWVLTVGATLAAIGLQGVYAGNRPLTDAVDPSVLDATLGTRFGEAMVFRLALLLVAGVFMWMLLKRSSNWRRLTVLAGVGVVGAGMLATPGMAGHAAAAEHAGLMMASDVVHLAAAAFWLGGLGVLVVALLRGDTGAALDDVVSRFSRLAFAAVVVVLATGTLQGWQQLESLDALTRTTYGRLLMVKTGVFAAMVAVAALSRQWVHKRFVRGLRRSVAAEVAGGAAVLAVTALLVNAVPGRTALAMPFSTTLAAGRVDVDVTVDPAKAGPTDVHVYTLERADGAVKDIGAVTAVLRPPGGRGHTITAPLRRAGPGHYSAYGVELPVPGRWRLDVAVRVDGTEELRGRATIPVR